jgi:DNA polymerase III alpha subunit
MEGATLGMNYGLRRLAQLGVKAKEIRITGGGAKSPVWRQMMAFAGYSFCKPHSASYARVSFQAAYLKTHHPAPFMAAVISNQG